MGWRRRKGRSLESQQAAAEEEEDREKEESEEGKGKGFFACYLLCSLSPRRKGHTYIGFTVNPRRRIRQHNGEMRSGAWRTKRGRPWEMILCIYGFPSMVSALQFEWAWQHPIESLAVRKAASSFKSLAGIANKIKLAYTMLNLPSWENLNLVVNFFSTKYMKHTAGCPRLPKQMRINVCTMDELPCYTDDWSQDGNNDGDDDVNEEEVIDEDVNNSSSLSDIPVTGFTGDDVSCKGSDDSLSQESHRFTEPPVYTEDYERMQSGSSPFAWSQESGIDLLRWSLTPKNSSDEASTSKEMMADTTLVSSDSNVINLATPPSGTIPSRSTKRALAYSEVIDLTDSPIIIQL